MQLINQYMKLGARIWARPKRIAFLVDESFTDRDINTVVRYCIRHLGGRCNPIVPIQNDHLGRGWEELLVAVDPDVLYSFIPISAELEERLRKKLRPTRIVVANPAHRHDDGWRLSESEIGGIRLTDVDLPFGQSTFSTPSCPQITLDDFDQRSDVAISFCLRNFGAYSESDWKTFSLESKGVKMLPVAISNPETFLASMLPSAGRLYPSQLSTAGYEQDYFRCQPSDYHSEHYEVVIGDSLRDFLYVWNRGITLRFNWRRRAQCANVDLNKAVWSAAYSRTVSQKQNC